MCSYYDTEDCRFAYVYSYDQSGKIIIRAQEERECPPQVYFMGIDYIFKFYCINCMFIVISYFRYNIGCNRCNCFDWNGPFVTMETTYNN